MSIIGWTFLPTTLIVVYKLHARRCAGVTYCGWFFIGLALTETAQPKTSSHYAWHFCRGKDGLI